MVRSAAEDTMYDPTVTPPPTFRQLVSYVGFWGFIASLGAAGLMLTVVLLVSCPQARLASPQAARGRGRSGRSCAFQRRSRAGLSIAWRRARTPYPAPPRGFGPGTRPVPLCGRSAGPTAPTRRAVPPANATVASRHRAPELSKGFGRPRTRPPRRGLATPPEVGLPAPRTFPRSPRRHLGRWGGAFW